MEKYVFLSMLKSSLLQMNVPVSNINKHVDVFEKYFNGKTPEETKKIIKGIGGVDGALDAIYKIESKRNANILKPSDIKKNTVEAAIASVKENDAIKNNHDFVSKSSQEVDEIKKEETAEISIEKSNESTKELPKLESNPSDEDVELLFKKRQSKNAVEELEKTTINTPVVMPKDNFEFATELPPLENDIMAYKNRSIIVEFLKNVRSKMTDDVYHYTLPLTMLLNIFVYIILALLFPAVAIITAITYISYFVIMIGGGIVSAISMIYGVIKLGSSVSVGLYELGIGIIIIGLTLLMCVLIYNFNKKLVPYIFRKIKELFITWIKANKAFFRKNQKEVRK